MLSTAQTGAPRCCREKIESASLAHVDCACTAALVLLHCLAERCLACLSSRHRRSNNHIYGQIIDDSKDAVLTAASTMEKDVRESGAKGNNKEAAAAVGKRLAERALAKGITKVHFDRNGRPYHGRIAALADGAREGGLEF